MSPLLLKSQWRYLATRWWLVLVSILGIAVGVAGPVSMDLTISSCQRAFELSTTALSGRSTHAIEPLGDTLDERLYTRLRLELGVHSCAPVVEGAVTTRVEGHEHSLRILGLDAFVESDFRGQLGIGGMLAPGIGKLLSEPGTGLISRRSGLNVGSRVHLLGGQEVRIAGLLDPADERSAQALEGLLLVDIATAQELLGKVGQLSRIDLILPEGPLEQKIREALPHGVELVPAGRRATSMRQMTSAFFLNLQALSLLSLLVGALLVYNVSRFLVVERQPILGRMRTLGVTNGEILTLVVGECLLLTLFGLVLGEVAGCWLARVLLALVGQTINDLYYATEVSRVQLNGWVLAKGVILGLVAALFAAWGPARAATRAPLGQGLSRSSFFEHNQRWLDRAGGLGVALWLAGWAVLMASESSLPLSLVGIALNTLGMACLTPWSVKWLNRGLLRVLRSRLPILGRLALGSIERDLDWTGVALATLTIAISATISIGLMVFSFRESLLHWLEQTLQADIYITLADRNAGKGGSALDPVLVAGLQKLSAVDQWSLLRVNHALIRIEGQPKLRTILFANQIAPKGQPTYVLVAGDPSTAWPRFQAGDLLVSDPFAYRNHVQPGQKIAIDTPTGVYERPVVGVFADYTSETGYVMLAREPYRQHFGDEGLTGMAAFLKDPSTAASVLKEIEALPGAGAADVHSNRSLRELSVEIFERTFQVTGILRILAIAIALAGIFGALAALQLARRRDAALYRALGMTARESALLQLLQTTVAGLWAGLFAVPAGICEAYAMVVFINRRAFGWRLSFSVQPGILLQAPTIALVSSGLAGVLTVWAFSRNALSARLQEE